MENQTTIYSFKELTRLIDLSDTNNSNKEQREDAESKLRHLGFYNEDGEILPENFNKSFRTTDGKSLEDLEDYFELHYS